LLVLAIIATGKLRDAIYGTKGKVQRGIRIGNCLLYPT
jgi:hypothetical protein